MVKQQDSKFSPADFMRGRRPELYSDSTYTQKRILDRTLFEYHLETLTARKQEYEFERFCTLLAERELCPNLLPQTGPTGGGDSKVDSETYPVADALSANWYEGIARDASKERWAFAFSAKKEWQSKIRSDVQKIAETDRGYTVVYFMTNQFVSDKQRSKMEDELTAVHSFSVRILDRTWIVETVLKKGHEDIASDALGLSADYKRTKHVGALDAEREARLKEIDELVAKRAQTLTKYALCEEVLTSAIIARQLEKSKEEVYARFDRAIGLANEVGYVAQQIRCSYQKAWTAFWWFEDYETLNSQYDQVEALVFTTDHAEEFEYLVNLLTVAYRLKHGVDSAKFMAGRKKVLDRLQRLSTDSSRPNNAIYARSLTVSLRLLDAFVNKDGMETVFEEIKLILKESEILIGFPVTILIRIIQEIGDFLPDIPVVDEVFDLATSMLEKKSSEESAVDLLLDRASFKVKHDKPYEALEKIEQAVEKSFSCDSRNPRIKLLLILSRIYETVGLPWAARGAVLLAMDLLFCELSDSGYGVDFTKKAFRRLLWIELQLGRTLHVLDVHHLFLNFVGKFADPENDLYDEEHSILDAVLGLLIVKTNLDDLEPLSVILPALEEHGLYHSHEGLLYALGYEDEVLENLKEVLCDKDDLHHFFKLWRNQPAYHELPDEPVFFRQKHSQIISRVLGTKLVVSFEKNDPAINFSETLLACLEAMMARYLNEPVWPCVDEFKIEIVVDGALSGIPRFEFPENQTHADLRITLPQKFAFGSIVEQSEYRKMMHEMMVMIMVRIVHLPKIKAVIEKTKGSISVAGILSDVIVTSMCSAVSNTGDWLDNGDNEPARKLIRETRWDSAYTSSDTAPEMKFGKGDMPGELLDCSAMKHSQREVISYIKSPYWDKAQWTGTGFMWSDAGAPPLLMLLFKNETPGDQIFEDWRNRLGTADTDEAIRISIIRGINKGRPHDYRVLISGNLKKTLSESKQFLIMNRRRTMTPVTSSNLEMFIQRYQEAKSYYIAPAHVIDLATSRIRPQFDLMIQKKEINIRWAWEIGRHDPDAAGIDPEDDPLIPADQTAPPVAELLAQLRNMKNGKQPDES